jgi:hypothetical protein
MFLHTEDANYTIESGIIDLLEATTEYVATSGRIDFAMLMSEHTILSKDQSEHQALYEAAAGGAIEKMKQNAQKWWNQFVETIKRIVTGTLKTKYMKKKEWIDSAASTYGKKDGSPIKINDVDVTKIEDVISKITTLSSAENTTAIMTEISNIRKAQPVEVTIKKGDVAGLISKYRKVLNTAAIKIPTEILAIQNNAAMKKAMQKISLNGDAAAMKAARDEVAAAQTIAKDKLKAFSALIALADSVLSDIERAIKSTGGKEETADGGGTPTPTPPAGGGTPQNESANLFAQFFSS